MRGKRPGTVPALGHGRQRQVGARGGRAGGVRGPGSPEQAPVQALLVPGNFSPPTTRSQRARRRSPGGFRFAAFSVRTVPAPGPQWLRPGLSVLAPSTVVLGDF